MYLIWKVFLNGTHENIEFRKYFNNYVINLKQHGTHETKIDPWDPNHLWNTGIIECAYEESRAVEEIFPMLGHYTIFFSLLLFKTNKQFVSMSLKILPWNNTNKSYYNLSVYGDKALFNINALFEWLIVNIV